MVEVLSVLLEVFHDRLPGDVREALASALAEAESIRNSLLVERDPVLRVLLVEKRRVLEKEGAAREPGLL